MTRIYCQSCGPSQPMLIDRMKSDDLNGDTIWGDLCCGRCYLVLATIEVDEPGIYDFMKVTAEETKE